MNGGVYMTKNAFVQENLYDTEWMNEEGEMRDRVMNSQELAAGLLFLLKEYYIQQRAEIHHIRERARIRQRPI